MNSIELYIDVNDNSLESLIGYISDAEWDIRRYGSRNVELIVSFEQYTFAKPRTMTVLTAFLNDLNSKYPNVELIVLPPKDTDAKNYMTRFNFFDLNPFCEEAPVYPYQRYDAAGRFIELKQFDNKSKDQVNNELTQLITSKIQGSNDFKLSLAYSLFELTDNTCCHSAYHGGGVLCGQPYSGEVEIAIADRGIGIIESLKQTEKYWDYTDADILLESVKENVSSKLNDPHRDHQGFGLYALNEFIKQGNGLLEIYSNGVVLKTERGVTTARETYDYQGTMIYFSLPIGYNTIQWGEIMNRLFVNRGAHIPDHLLDTDYEDIF